MTRTMGTRKGETMAYVVSICFVLLTLLCCVAGQAEQVIHYTIREEVPEDTWIGNVATSLGLNASMGVLEFGYLSSSNPHQQYFHVCCGGELRTRGRYDRDAICAGSMEPCVLSVVVTVRTRDGGFYIGKVLVEVEDIEDNAPQFPTSQHELMVSESTQPLASFSLPVASDADASPLSYTLTPELSEFALRVRSGGECHLVVRAALDREQRAAYALVLAARDAAGNTARLQLQLSVTDVNDNAPHFLPSSEYAVSVLESVGVGATLLHVNAHDPDAGDNGRVRYSLSRQAEAALGDVFRVDALTGAVLLLAPLNYGRRSQYVLRVAAHDGGSSSLAAYATVTVSVQDLNDHAPHIRINALTAVTEHAAPGAFVAHLLVEDEDGEDNGKFECSLNDTNFSLKRTFPTEYKLVTALSLDRERQSQYPVLMQCRDLGTPPQQSSLTINVTVADINDNAPRFHQAVYEASVAEDALIGSFVARVRASDADAGHNGRIVYALRGACAAVLAVHQTSGVVSVRARLDHEQRSKWDCQVQATDSAGSDSTGPDSPATPDSDSALSAASTLRLAVRDVNDEAPHFPAPRLTLSVRENRAPGAGVGDVVAYDRDAPPHNILNYRLSEPSSSFSIHPDSGSVSTRIPLDRETQDQYAIQVIAEDQGGLSSQVAVHIMVLDENDNAPKIQAPNSTLQVSPVAQVGHIITHVRATDADTSHNAQLRYYLTAASIPNLFAINPLSGSISLSQGLHDYTQRNISLSVVVRDRGEPSLEDTAELFVYVNASLGGDAAASTDDIPNASSIIIIAVLSATAVVSIILIVAIVLILRRRKQRKDSTNQKPAYSCHVEPTIPDRNTPTPIGKYPQLSTAENKSDFDTDSILSSQHPRSSSSCHQPGSTLPQQQQQPGSQRAPSRGAGVYGSSDTLGQQSHLTAGKLQVYNDLIPHHPHSHNAPIPDGESDRGSSDSGRGASEEECQNTSSDSLPVRPSQGSRSDSGSGSGSGSRSVTPLKATGDCVRHSARRYPDRDRNLDRNLDLGGGVPIPAVPKRSCKLHGHLAAVSEAPKYPGGASSHHNVPAKHNVPKYPAAPMDYNNGGYAQSFDTSMDGHSDGGSTTSGEYVLNLDDFTADQPSISKDVYV